MDITTFDILKSILNGIGELLNAIIEYFKMNPHMGILALITAMIPSKKRS